MNKLTIQKLFASFNDLVRAIVLAKDALEKRPSTPPDVLRRIEAYGDILHKQKELATALCCHSTMGNLDEVSRHIKIINGLSVMIRDDAKEILTRTAPRLENGDVIEVEGVVYS